MTTDDETDDAPDADADVDPDAGDATVDEEAAGDADEPTADSEDPAEDVEQPDADAEGADPASMPSEEPLGNLRDRVVADEAGASPRDSGDTEDDAVGADSGIDGDAVDTDRSGPLGDVASGIDERRQRKTPADDELFEAMDVGEVDSDALWEQVEEEDPVVTEPGQREIREIYKHKYCKKCPHFSAPPQVHCTNEGTDILEQIDMDHFKVADCPIVLEDERLEDVTTE